jgi:hypothetical protein
MVFWCGMPSVDSVSTWCWEILVNCLAAKALRIERPTRLWDQLQRRSRSWDATHEDCSAESVIRSRKMKSRHPH